MTTLESPRYDEENHQSARRTASSSSQKRQYTGAKDYSSERPPTGPGRGHHSPQSQRVTNGAGASYGIANDAEYNSILLEHLSADFANLLNRTDISDCFLSVKGTYMAVHKSILVARSSVFAAVISGDFNRLVGADRYKLETLTHKDKLVIVVDKTEPEIMKQVVVFMYTARCDLNEGNSYALLDAAGRYDIKDLKVYTGRFLSNLINSNNVLMLLKAAYKFDNKLVKHRCIEYFINHAKEIIDLHELWKQFAEEQKEIVAELLHWLVHKDDFYASKPQWDARSVW